jgi:NADH dehydrogenase
MNLVIGASGLLGSEICRILLESGKPVRGLVRTTTDTAKQGKLRSLGADLAFGDLKDPSTLGAAMQGVSAVISTASTTFSRQAGDSIETVDLQGQINLVNSAKEAGVGHFVFISFPPMAEDFALQRAKRAVEDRLMRSGLAYTILQPTFFTEVWLSPAVGFDAANARAQIFGPGRNQISWISFLDVAKFAAGCAENPATRNMTIQLGGPQALSPLEVVKVFEEVGGRSFTLTHVPEDALRAQKAAATNSHDEAFPALMISYAQGNVIDMGPAFRIFPQLRSRLSSVEEYAKSTLNLA